MKIKQQPEDFQVEELTDVAPGQGPFALYRLEKRSWSTPDALQALRRRWRIDLRRLSYGGLKDRHAVTVQHLTIFHGPQRNLTHQGFTVRYLGQVSEPYTSKDIRANRFRITLRNLPESQTAALSDALEQVRREGVPNYFDDQRFGSVAPDGEFIGKALVQGRFEEALRLALAAGYEHDRSQQKREKAILRKHWGNWAECKQRLPRFHERTLVDYLAQHPADFRGAVAQLRPELRGLYLSAYQSHLWNRILARWLEQHSLPDQLIPVLLQMGKVPMHQRLGPSVFAELAGLQLPLPSARQKLDPADARTTLVESVLAEEGLQLSQLQIKGIREMFFSKAERAALCLPAELRWDLEEDELHPSRRKTILSFDLPRGCYATLIVKRIQAAAVTSS